VKYLLDTNICVFVIRQKSQAVVQRLRAQAVGEVGISAVALGNRPLNLSALSAPLREPSSSFGSFTQRRGDRRGPSEDANGVRGCFFLVVGGNPKRRQVAALQDSKKNRAPLRGEEVKQ
jgi:hypothetical protein